MPKKPELFKIDTTLDKLVQTTVQNNINSISYLTAKYSGKLPIGGKEINCAVLSDNSRIISSDAIFELFGKTRKGEYRVITNDGTKLPPFIVGKWMLTYMDTEFINRTKKIEFLDNGEKQFGYLSSILPDICNMYIEHYQTQDFSNLSDNQKNILTQARILLMAFAKTGLDALIDEATGFQKYRTHDALRILVQQYIAEGLRAWIKRFPDDFFKQLDRLYGNEPTKSRERPKHYGHFINKYVYQPIEHGYVKSELDKLNITDSGKRKARFHQWLSDHGIDVLNKQIWRLIGIMEFCKDINSFKRKTQEMEKISIAPYLFDEFNDIDNA